MAHPDRAAEETVRAASGASAWCGGSRTGWQSVDREIIADVIRAIDALAARCDELADRLEHQRIVLDDAVTILGEE